MIDFTHDNRMTRNRIRDLGPSSGFKQLHEDLLLPVEAYVMGSACNTHVRCEKYTEFLDVNLMGR
jgi:hypothetical protein